MWISFICNSCNHISTKLNNPIKPTICIASNLNLIIFWILFDRIINIINYKRNFRITRRNNYLDCFINYITIGSDIGNLNINNHIYQSRITKANHINSRWTLCDFRIARKRYRSTNTFLRWRCRTITMSWCWCIWIYRRCWCTWIRRTLWRRTILNHSTHLNWVIIDNTVSKRVWEAAIHDLDSELFTALSHHIIKSMGRKHCVELYSLIVCTKVHCTILNTTCTNCCTICEWNIYSSLGIDFLSITVERYNFIVSHPTFVHTRLSDDIAVFVNCKQFQCHRSLVVTLIG